MAQAGQPTKYKPEYCEQIIEHCAQGLSVEAFAGVVRVSRMTLYNWQDQETDFKEACEIAKSCSLLFWEQKGIDGLQETKSFNPQTGESHSHKMNAAVWIMNMKARHNWRDKVEISGDKEKPIQLQYAIGDQPPAHASLTIVASIQPKAANE